MTRHLPNEVVLASAGTGKTFKLSNRFIAILMRDPSLDPARILAATFTRKAAGEILDRVIQRVTAAAQNDEQSKTLSEQIGLERDPGIEAYRELLVRLSKSLHRLGISTIDAFVARVATCLGGEIGLPQGWRIGEQDEDDVLRSSAADSMLEEADEAELSALFRQWFAGGFGRDPHKTLLDITGALHAVFTESNGNASPWKRIKPPRATPEAAVKEAIAALRANPIVSAKSGAPIKRLPDAVERIHQSWLSREWVELLEESVIAKCLSGSNKYGNAEFAETIGDHFRKIGSAAAANALIDLAGRNSAAFGLIRKFDEAYRQMKDARSLYRFDDLPYRILAADFEEQLIHLYFRLDSEIKHVLLDEFQDTSILQFRLFEPIISELLDQDDPERSFFCVGDVKQSLYAWRGARSELLAGLSTRWESLAESTLQLSWRSAPCVLEFVNEVFHNIGERWSNSFENDGSEDAAALWASRWKPHESALKSAKGRVSVVRVCQDGESKAKELLSDSVVAKVRDLYESCPNATIAVLVRRNALIQHYIFELGKLGIHASGDGKSLLVDSACVSAIASLFHLADHPEDTASFMHVVEGPLGVVLGLPSRDEIHDLKAASRKLSRMWREKASHDGLVSCCKFLLKSVSSEIDARSYRRFEQLIELAVLAERRKENGPGDFAKMIRALPVEDEQPARVRVMTIHQSKGLEFNCVIIAELVSRPKMNAIRVLTEHVDEDGTKGVFAPLNEISICPAKTVIPHDAKLVEMARSKAADDAMSDLCVLYVAMTRAMNSLDVFIEGIKGEDENPSGIRSLVLQTAKADRQGKGVEELFSFEDAGWRETIKDKKKDARPILELPARKCVGLRSMHPLRWNRKSPSSFEGGKSRPLSETLTLSSQAGRERGSLIHKYCELVGWTDRGEIPSREVLMQTARSMGWDEGVAVREADWFLKTISGPVSAVLERGRYPGDLDVKIRREWSFATPIVEPNGATTLLTGAVDRLVTISRGGRVERAEILDFKTDHTGGPDSPAFAERIDHYRPQIEAYRHAVAQVFQLPIELISGTLVMLDACDTIRVTA